MNATIARHELQLQEIISDEGGFGVVWKGTCRTTEVAIKVPRNKMSQKQLADFRREVNILSSVSHPNICLFLGACFDNSDIYIVTEFMEGNVERLLKNPEIKLSFYQKVMINVDAAKGIAWLHASGIVHRDIKPSNYLYKKLRENKFQIKVCDFGLSDLNVPTLREKNPKGTPLYMSPEVLLGRVITEKVDVYSWAITLWETLTGLEPFSNVDSVESLLRFVCRDGFRPTVPNTWPDSLQTLIASCWHSLPEQRPSFEQTVQQLQHVLIDAAITDVQGRLFWRTAFPGKESVPFRDFSVQFFDQFEVLRGKIPSEDETAARAGYIGEIRSNAFAPSSSHARVSEAEAVLHQLRIYFLRVIRLLFIEDASPNQEVNVEYFGKCLQWVGPIEPDPFAFFFRLQQLYALNYFYGSIRTNDATSLLLTKPPGTFLVRFCNSVGFPGYFVLSVVTVQAEQQVAAHVRIKHSAGGTFALEKIPGPEYETLAELIDACRERLNLRKACPGRKYEYVYFESIQDEMQALRAMHAEWKQAAQKSEMELSASGE